jgi:hypothetical protein
VCCLAVCAAAADAPAVPRAAHPELVLPESGASGPRAIELLGDHLGAVAASYGMSPEALRHLLLSDRTARIDRRGYLYYVEEPDAPAPPASGASRR